MFLALLTVVPLSSQPCSRSDPTNVDAELRPPAELVLAEPDERWHWSVTPYLWAFGLDGDVVVEGQPSEVDVGFDQILDHLDLALLGHVEAWHGKWGFLFDGVFGELSGDGTVGAVDLEVTQQLTVLELDVARRVLERKLDATSERRWSVDVLGGARSMAIELEIDPDPPALMDRDDSQSWIDPLLGARVNVDLTSTLLLMVRGDYGGFGLSGSSDSAWNASAVLGWRFSRSASLAFGYRVLDVDYSDGGFAYDVQMSGPMLGVAFGN